LSSNGLGKLLVPDGWSYGYHNDYSGDEFYKHTDGRKAKSGTPEGTTSGAIIIAAAIPNMRALSTLTFGDAPDEDSRSNSEEEGTDWEPAVLEVGMTEADFSNKDLGPGDAIIISAWISHKDKGALTKFAISHNPSIVNEFNDGSGEEYSDGITALLNAFKSNATITDLNVAGLVGENSSAGSRVAALIVDAIKEMGVLSIANVMGNKMGKEQISKLQDIMRSKPNLGFLCGIADDATEADLSNLGMDFDDALILASELPGKRALTTLDISKNNLTRGVLKPGRYETDMTGMSTHGTHCWVLTYPHYHTYFCAGITAVAGAVKDMGALSKLDASDNNMFGKEDKTSIIAWAAALKACTSITELNLAKNEINAKDTKILALAISDMGALSFLNLAGNSLGNLVEGPLPDGWKSKDDDDSAPWLRIEDGHKQNKHPNAKPEGIIALANVIPDMGAMTSLNLASIELGDERAKIIAACLPKCK
jgi:hypothetical protein